MMSPEQLIQKLEADNARLRAALQWIKIYSNDTNNWAIHKVSSEALKDLAAIDAALEESR